MESYQIRVVDEKNDLDLKIKKLGDFLDAELSSNLSVSDRSLLKSQLHYMQGYSSVLGMRIAAF